MRNLAIGFTIGAGVGAGGVYVYLQAGPLGGKAASADTIWPAADPIRAQAASEFGVPVTDAVRVFDGYCASYDFRTRNPKWVLEHITAESLAGDATRNKSEFFEDPGVDARFRAKLSDFKESGYDRGHMAPAADLKATQKSMDESFNLVNISPQVGAGFNRDYWARFERYLRSVSHKVDDVYVITGPLWLPRPDADGKWTMQHTLIGEPPALVSVPTHYYKVVLADARGGKHPRKDVASGVYVGAFVMPNAPIDDKIPLSAFAVPLEPLEQVAGAKFFPSYLTDARRSAIDSGAHAWRSHGLQHLKPFERLSLVQDMAVLPAPPPKEGGAAIVAAAVVVSADGGGAGAGGRLVPPPPPNTGMRGGTGHLCVLDTCKLPGPWRGPGGGGGGGGDGGNDGKRNFPDEVISQTPASLGDAMTSDFYGVSWYMATSAWKAQLYIPRSKRLGDMQGKSIKCIGSSDSEVDAAMAYDCAAVELNGSDWPKRNFPGELITKPPKSRGDEQMRRKASR
ncbi:hypothetical protein FOA52_007981 [Chlamydomonas sp. UWO 241]|nr:hypothetical protein FOA52_007981 [Chlamydomonas sp. UWO 241]